MTSEAADRQAQLAETFREAEQAGLRIAIKGRLAALVLLGTFLVLSRLANPAHALELEQFPITDGRILQQRSNFHIRSA